LQIYLAGPMRHIKDFNFPAFFEAADKLREQGHIVFNPAEKDVKKYGEKILKSPSGSIKTIEKRGFSLRDALALDLAWICKKADGVAMLPGWRNSKGATAEHATAQALGLEIIYL